MLSFLLLHVCFLWEFSFRGGVQFKIIPLEWVSILTGSWELCCRVFFPPCWVFGEPHPGALSPSLPLTPYFLLEAISKQSFWTGSGPVLPMKESDTLSSTSGNARTGGVSAFDMQSHKFKNLDSLRQDCLKSAVISLLSVKYDTCYDSEWR